ncbi:MAG: class I SAM-dependent methyltransferase [Paraglaciecola sp.]|nr:class I SAM-dependent methyltransferase [Paraglaciecola sp.]
METDYCLLKWFSALNVGGELVIKVPNADFYARMWLNANWSEETLRDNESDARRSFSTLWGRQSTGNPRDDNYDAQYKDVFKSAYNNKRLSFLLQRAGFVDIDVKESDEGQLIACAKKSMDKGERQVATDYKNIRDDHKNRYQFACEQLAEHKPTTILDLACGIGYGSLMLAKNTDATITGVDIDLNAIDYAKQYFSNQNTNFICADAKKHQFSDESYDAIVSFETIEHVTFDKKLLRIFNRALKAGGIFICSTPNQDVMPFDPDKFRFHIKHYKNSELIALLTETGFNNIQLFTQLDSTSGPVIAGDNGCFTIAVASKSSA